MAVISYRLWQTHFAANPGVVGQTIEIKNAPTHFGLAEYRIVSDVDHGVVAATVSIPSRQPAQEICLRVRHPKSAPMKSVRVNGTEWTAFDAGREVVMLRGLKGSVKVEIHYRKP